LSTYMTPVANNKKKERLIYIAFAFIMAISYDFLVWDHELGLGFFLFSVAYLVGFVLINAIFDHVRQRTFLLLTIPFLIMSGEVLFFGNRLVTELVPFLIIMQGIFLSVVLTLRNPHGTTFTLRGIPIFQLFLFPAVMIEIGDVIKDVFYIDFGGRKQAVRKVIVGIGLAIPLLVVFAALFYAADDIFATYFQKIFDVHISAEIVWRIFRIGLMALLAAGFFYVLIKDSHTLEKIELKAAKYDQIVTSVVLSLVNALFLIFVAIQIKYFFGNASFVFDNDITFAEYARNGFFELVWIMVIAALFISFIYRSFTYHRHSRFVNFLLILLIAQVGVVAVSALRRMELYQDVFGFTVLRLYVEWFIYFTIAVLLFSVISILKNTSFRIFFFTSAGLGLVALTIVSVVNVDAVIAQENIRRFVEEEKSLDTKYLRWNMSAIDVAPSIAQVIASESFHSLDESQKKNLYITLAKVTNEDARRESILEFHFGVQRAVRAFDSLRSGSPDVVKKINYYTLLEAMAEENRASCPAAFNKNGIFSDCVKQYRDNNLYVMELVSPVNGMPQYRIYEDNRRPGTFDEQYTLLFEHFFPNEQGVSLLKDGSVIVSDPALFEQYHYPVVFSGGDTGPVLGVKRVITSYPPEK